MSKDRFGDVWERLLNVFLGRKAVKQVDACALYWGTVAAINGNKVDVTLDTKEVPSPSGVPLLLGLPSSTVEGIAGQRALVGFLNGDISQPYAMMFEFSSTSSLITIGTSSPKEAVRKGDPVNAGSLSGTVLVAGSPVAVQFTYTTADGVPGAPGPTAAMTGGKNTGGSTRVKIGG